MFTAQTSPASSPASTTARCWPRLASGSCGAGTTSRQPGTRALPARSSAASPRRLPVRAARPGEAAPPGTSWPLATVKPPAARQRTGSGNSGDARVAGGLAAAQHT